LADLTGQVVEAAGKISARLGSAHITSFSDVVQLPAVVRVLDRLREHAGMTPEDLQQWAHDLAGRISLMGPALSARLAFSVFDDTDLATVENVMPVYDLLADLGFPVVATSGNFSGGVIVANGTPAQLRSKSPSGKLEDVFRQLTIGKEEAA